MGTPLLKHLASHDQNATGSAEVKNPIAGCINVQSLQTSKRNEIAQRQMKGNQDSCRLSGIMIYFDFNF